MGRTVLAVAFCLLNLSLALAQQVRPAPCLERPPTEGLQLVIEGAELVELLLQGRVGYEGAEPDARPLPRASPHDLAEDLSASIRTNRRRGKAINPNALYFTFYADTTPGEQETVAAPKSVLWCLARRGDTVLLSDGPDPHVTSVFSINRETGRIFILDPWPEQFFMLKGKNVRGYTAELVDVPELASMAAGGRRLISIPRDQFLKVVAGLVTLDTPDLIAHYFRLNPPALNRASTQLAFGLGLLNWSDDRFVERSIPLFRKANELSRTSGNKTAENYGANRLHLALLVQYYQSFMARDRAGADAAMAEMQELWGRYGKEPLMASNRPLDFYRLALDAGQALDLDSAVEFFTRAIARKADYQEAYLYRALAKSQMRNPGGAAIDASEALKLNAGARANLAKQKAARHRRDTLGQARDAATEAYLDQWKGEALQIRGRSFLALGDNERALEDGQAFVALQPGNAKAYALVGFAHKEAGNLVEARRNLEKAAQLETDPASLQGLKSALADIH